MSTPPSANVVVLTGTLSAPPEVRAVASGTAIEFVVTTEVDDQRLRVPVNWVDPPASALVELVEGLEVVVVGHVRRRFFRAGGRTQSRTEVIPERVVPTRRRVTVERLLRGVAERLVVG